MLLVWGLKIEAWRVDITPKVNVPIVNGTIHLMAALILGKTKFLKSLSLLYSTKKSDEIEEEEKEIE